MGAEDKGVLGKGGDHPLNGVGEAPERVTL
jgi:hypothetical protein